MTAGQGGAQTKLVLVVIDGLTPSMLEGALGTETAPTLTALAERGTLGRATTTFPSLTPVCLSSIATGAHPDVHEIPHLVWWHRGEQRLVEYGSSFGAARAAGLGRTLRDTLVGMNAEHLGRNAVTLFEALADAGYRTAAVNFTAYRGRTLHRPAVPLLDAVHGPERFYFYNLFRADRTGAPLSFRNRAGGSIDAYAAAVGRWLVTRDGFDFLLLYLSDYDYASHAAGPDAATEVLARCDAAVGGLVSAAGGLDEFLERYAVVVMSDHGQTAVREIARLGDRFRHEAQTLVDGLEPGRSRLPPRCRGPCAPRPRGAPRRRAVGRGGALRGGGRRRRAAGGRRAPDRESAVTARCSTETRACSTIRTRSPARSPRCGARTQARSSSRPLPAGSSRTSAAATTSAADRTDRSSRATRWFRCSPSASRGPAPSALVDVAPAILAHFGARVPEYAVDRAA